MSSKTNELRKSNGAAVVRAKAAREWLDIYPGTQKMPLALLLIGIRDLKQINERVGRSGGDSIMRKVGTKIRQFAEYQISDFSFIARLPGREFLLAIGDERSSREIEMFARSMLDILTADFGREGEPIHISARIGIAIAAENENGTELLHRAGTALSQAYDRKGKRFAFAEFRKTASSHIASSLDSALRSAIDKREITIMMQPQFAVENGKLVGAEALARWHHNELGEVGAGALFASADRCDLREELSHLIQQEAVAIAANWPDALSDLRLAVNLGAEELTDGYSDRLFALLKKTGFSATRLTLELTEESLVRDIDQAAHQLEQLRAEHIQIAVDDFGTGYSSLAYLKQLPLDYLKIDKGMTPDIGGTGKDRIVLRAIIAMGKALGLKIIAEGVEHESELAMLKDEECDYFQGFLRSQPLSADDFISFALRSS